VNYDLANDLKEAGFLQSGAGSRAAPPDKVVVRRDDFAYVPTLEELINACGDAYGNLSRWDQGNDKGNWHAISYDADYDEWGATPTEAVARLWLALN
jgi:hypothetical protein